MARVVNFAATALIAQRLGPAGFGNFSFALTLFVAFSLIANFGLENLIVREVARARQGINRFIGRAVIVKLLALPFGAAVVAFIATRDASLAMVAAWLFLYGQMHAELLFICAIFRGFEQMERQTMLVSLQSLLMAAGAIIALFLTANPVWVAAAHGVGATVVVVLGWVWLIRRGIVPEVRWEPAAWRTLAWLNVPFTLAMLGLLVFDRQTVLFIEWQGNRAALGWFNAVYLLILALANVPIVITNALFPLLARRAHQGQAVTPVVVTALRLVTLLGVPLAVVLYLVAPVAVPVMYGEAFRPAAAILQRLAFSVPFIFWIVLLNGVLQTLDAQHAAARAFAMGLVVALPLTGWLTFQYGYMGGTTGYVFSAVLLAGVLAVSVWQRLRGMQGRETAVVTQTSSV